MSLSWSVVIHLLLFLAAIGYAALLNAIYELYHPDHTWITVVGGVCLVGVALIAEYAALGPSWLLMPAYFTLNGAAGIPIIRWQRRQARKRRAAAEAIDQRP
jgi:hypothetical protein